VPGNARDRSEVIFVAAALHFGLMAASTDTVAHLLRAQGLRRTPQRLAIMGELMSADGALVASALAARVQDKLPGVSVATVYRTLDHLERLGMLVHVHLASGLAYRRVDLPQHAYLTCGHCGSELAVPQSTLRPLEELVRREYGFLADFTHHAIAGVCVTCAKARTAKGAARLSRP
jgi:Fe2+ or Zn2+ uptake regulation protein